jgi:hypothetical protein
VTIYCRNTLHVLLHTTVNEKLTLSLKAKKIYSSCSSTTNGIIPLSGRKDGHLGGETINKKVHYNIQAQQMSQLPEWISCFVAGSSWYQILA